MKLLRFIPFCAIAIAMNTSPMERFGNATFDADAKLTLELLRTLFASLRGNADSMGLPSELHCAIFMGDFKMVQRLITPNNVNTPDRNGFSPLVFTISTSRRRVPNTNKMIHFLCDQGAWIGKQVGLVDALKFSCLFAATTGILDPAKILIQRGGDPLRSLENQKSVWDSLVPLLEHRKNKVPFVYEVLDLCLDKSNSLHEAAMACNPEKVKQLLSHSHDARVCVLECDAGHNTPLFHAIIFGAHANKERVRATIALLISAGANPNARSNIDLPSDFSFMHLATQQAVEKKTCRVLKALLENGGSLLARGDSTMPRITVQGVAEAECNNPDASYAYKVRRVLENHMPHN